MENQFSHLDVDQIDENYYYYINDIWNLTKGVTLLMKHIMRHNYNYVEYLLKTYDSEQLSKELHKITSNGFTPLKLAALFSENDIQIIKLLLDYKADINQIDGCDNQSSLMVASICSNCTSSNYTVKYLISRKADVNYTCSLKWTALMYASLHSPKYSNTETVKILLESKSNINAKNNDNKTPLMLSLFKYNDIYDINIDVVKLLLNFGASCNYQIIRQCFKNTDSDNIRIASLLLKQHGNYLLKKFSNNGYIVYKNGTRIVYYKNGVLLFDGMEQYYYITERINYSKWLKDYYSILPPIIKKIILSLMINHKFFLCKYFNKFILYFILECMCI